MSARTDTMQSYLLSGATEVTQRVLGTEKIGKVDLQAFLKKFHEHGVASLLTRQTLRTASWQVGIHLAKKGANYLVSEATNDLLGVGDIQDMIKKIKVGDYAGTLKQTLRAVCTNAISSYTGGAVDEKDLESLRHLRSLPDILKKLDLARIAVAAGTALALASAGGTMTAPILLVSSALKKNIPKITSEDIFKAGKRLFSKEKKRPNPSSSTKILEGTPPSSPSETERKRFLDESRTRSNAAKRHGKNIAFSPSSFSKPQPPPSLPYNRGEADPSTNETYTTPDVEDNQNDPVSTLYENQQRRRIAQRQMQEAEMAQAASTPGATTAGGILGGEPPGWQLFDLALKDTWWVYPIALNLQMVRSWKGRQDGKTKEDPFIPRLDWNHVLPHGKILPLGRGLNLLPTSLLTFLIVGFDLLLLYGLFQALFLPFILMRTVLSQYLPESIVGWMTDLLPSGLSQMPGL